MKVVIIYRLIALLALPYTASAAALADDVTTQDLAADSAAISGKRLMRRVLADGHIAAADASTDATIAHEPASGSSSGAGEPATAMRGSSGSPGTTRGKQRDTHMSIAVDDDGEVSPPHFGRSSNRERATVADREASTAAMPPPLPKAAPMVIASAGKEERARKLTVGTAAGTGATNASEADDQKEQAVTAANSTEDGAAKGGGAATTKDSSNSDDDSSTTSDPGSGTSTNAQANNKTADDAGADAGDDDVAGGGEDEADNAAAEKGADAAAGDGEAAGGNEGGGDVEAETGGRQDGGEAPGEILLGEHEIGDEAAGRFNTSEEALAAMGMESADDLWKRIEENEDESAGNGSVGKWDCAVRETNLTEDGGGDMSKFAQHQLNCGEEFLSDWRLSRAGTSNRMQFKYKCCEASQVPDTCVKKTTSWRSSEGGKLMALKHHQVACDGEAALTGWWVQTQGTNIRIEYRCCKLPGSMKFGTCTDGETKAGAMRSNARDLVYHPTTCEGDQVLTSWKMNVLEDGGKFNLQHSCCPVGTVAELGKERMCWWVGDPHFKTFDGSRHDPVRLGKGRFYWVVKSSFVQIQSYYQGFGHNTPALGRGVAFGGKFLGGHKLVVSWDMNMIKGQDPKYRRVPHIKMIHTYDGKPITFNNGKSPKEMLPKLHYRRQNRHCWLTTVQLPLNVHAAIQSCNGYMNTWLKMRELPGGQDGHCGNNDGNKNQKRWHIERQKNYPTFQVKKEENMFTGNFTGVGEDADGKTIDDCKGEARKRAEAACTRRFSGGGHKEQFIKMCIFDVCFTTEEAASDDAHAEEEEEKEEEMQRAREYVFILKRRSVRYGRKVCSRGQRQIVRIRSPGEQRAAVEAISKKSTRSSKLIWIGGRRAEGAWRWDDGDWICGYTNWKSKAEENSTLPFLCMERDTGKWVGCDTKVKRSQLCESKRHYGALDAVQPVEARTVCGAGKQLAMPKNLAEQTSVREASMDAVSSLVYLGARYKPDGWEWDDGTPLGCAFTYWDKGQPNMTEKDHKTLFLCASGWSGLWRTCTGYEQKLAAVCETAHPSMGCHMGKVSAAKLGLSKNPGEQFAEFGDECWYLGVGTEDCISTCAKQIGGVCSQEGLDEGSHPDSCKMILQSFGNIGDTNSSMLANKEGGCTYIDDGKTSRVVVEGDEDNKPTCRAKVESYSQHRVCSCRSVKSRPYPKDYVMTSGDTVRVSCGVGMEKQRSGIVDGQDIQFAKKKGIQLKGDVVTKSEGNGWSSGGISARKATGEGVGVIWTMQTNKNHYMVGLQSASKAVKYTYTDIDFAFYCDRMHARVYESGKHVKYLGKLTNGQTLQVRISNEKKVEYVADGKVLYTSTKAPAYPLVASTSMYDRSAAFERFKWFALPPPGMQKPFDIALVQKVKNEETALKLRVVPHNGTACWVKGKQNCTDAIDWPVEGTGHDNIDIVAGNSPIGKDIWSVIVSGTELPRLEMERPDEDITGVSVEGPTKKPEATLIHPEIIDAYSSVSMNSDNAVMQHDVELEDVAEMTTSFWAVFKKVNGTSCIRCEDTSLKNGTQLLMRDGHLVFEAANATPRSVTFSNFTFDVKKKYGVKLAYMSLQKMLELWVDEKKVGTMFYKEAGSIDIGKGFVGGHIDDEFPIAGKIVRLNIRDDVQFRLKAGLAFCTHYECPKGYELKEWACDMQCAEAECEESDRDMCCDEEGAKTSSTDTATTTKGGSTTAGSKATSTAKPTTTAKAKR